MTKFTTQDKTEQNKKDHNVGNDVEKEIGVWHTVKILNDVATM
jgi:hypothetical protein